MSIGVPLGRNIRQVGDEPQDVNMGAAVFVCFRNREISDMVVKPFPRASKPAKGTMCPSNHCVLNRALVPAPVGPKHHLIAELRRVIGDRVEHEEPLPTRGFEGLDLEASVPPPHRAAACSRLDNPPELGPTSGIQLATKLLEGPLERANRGCVT